MAREVKLPDGTINVRGLKRKELKEFKASGVNFSVISYEKADEVMDGVFGKIFSPEQVKMIEDLENKFAIDIWKACMNETFGSRDEEKNS